MTLANATRSELTKQFSTSMWWILGIVLVVYIGSTAGGLAAVFGASASGVLPGDTTNMPPLPDDAVAPIIYSLATAVGYVFPLLIGTLLVTGEFRHKTLTPTFLATPRRGIALGGKVVAGVIMGLLYAILALAATVLPGAGIMALFGIGTQLDDAATWALLGRMIVAFVLWALIGIGIGTLVRNQVGAVVGVLAFTQFVEPIVRVAAGFVDGLSDATKFLPGAASDALVGASLFTTIGGDMGAAAGAGLESLTGGLVLLGYAVVLLVFGYLFSWRRDVT